MFILTFFLGNVYFNSSLCNFVLRLFNLLLYFFITYGSLSNLLINVIFTLIYNPLLFNIQYESFTTKLFKTNEFVSLSLCLGFLKKIMDQTCTRPKPKQIPQCTISKYFFSKQMAVPHLQIQTPCLNQYLPFKIPNSPLAPTLLNVNDIQQTYYLSR